MYIPHILLVLFLVYVGVCVLYYLFQEKFIFVPTWPADNFESRLSIPAEEFTFSTPHDGRIHGILLRVPDSRGIILYLHGNTGSLHRWQFMAEELTTYGFDVMAIDYRGYGLSHGPRRESWMHRDVEHIYDYLAEHFPDKPVVIYGRSLGSGFATRLASRRKCAALVLETPFNNLLSVARHYVPFLPVRLLLRYQLRSDLFLPHVHCPVLILHGTRDIVVPHRLALELYRSSSHKANVQMTTITGGRHSNLNAYPLFRERLTEFLSGY